MTIDELHLKLSQLAFSAIGDEPFALHKPRNGESIVKRRRTSKPKKAEIKTYIQISLFD
ncbi:hypothetical protein [Arenibacter certesii]|nr:hypothetical protein [Arenibacter certesii]